MGAAAPSGIVTLVLIESRTGGIPARIVDEFNGIALAEESSEFSFVFARASDALAFAFRVVRDRGEGARVAVVTHEMDLEDSDRDHWAYLRARAVLSGAFDGMILVSAGTREVLGHSPEDFGLMHLGKFSLPDVERPETLYRLTHASLPSSFPRPTRFSQAPHDIPGQHGAFLGRDLEIESIRDHINQSRKIVLLGPAGIGKSRLAAQFGQEFLENDFDGVWFISLQSVVNVQERLGTYTADRIGAVADPSLGSVERISARLKGLNAVLIFDGCEVAANSVSRLVPQLTAACPSLLVILTTQVPLNIEKQSVYEVPPLSREDATALFIDRVCLSQPEFDPTEEEEARIAGLCDELANIPIAIELVAPMYLESGGNIGLEPSQQTVVTRTLDWIISQRTVQEQNLALAASAFNGPIRADAAVLVAGGGDPGEMEMLARKKLLIAEGSGIYRMPVPIRDYFAEKHPSRHAELQVVHANHFADYAVSLGEEFARTGEISAFAADIENFIQALENCHQRRDSDGAFKIGFNVFDYWYRRGLYKEGIYWLRQVLEVSQDPFTRARVQNLLASIALGGALFEEGNAHASEGISIAEGLKSDILLARLYSNSGLLLYGQEMYEIALDALKRAKRYAKKVKLPTAVIDLYTAVILAEIGNHDKAERAFATIKETALPVEMRNYLDLRKGILRNFEGRWAEARDFIESALKQSHAIEDISGICGALRSLVIAYAGLGLFSQSARLVGMCDAMSERTFDFWPSRQRELFDESIKRSTARLGASIFQELRAEGFEVPVDRLVRELDWKMPSGPG